MTTHRTTSAAAGVLALAVALTGCTADGEPTPTATTPEGTTTPEETPSPSPTETADEDPDETEEPSEDEVSDELPPGFPDPQDLVGQEAYDEQGEDGWRTVVGGEPLDLDLLFGACFEGGTGETCAFSISGSGSTDPEGIPEPGEPALLLLLRSAGEREDGTPVWEVLDALVTRPPDDAGILQVCQGEEGVAFYPDEDAPQGETLPVAAAWGPDDDVTGLEERDPEGLTCEAAMP
jgi:hypothetical protein